MCLRQISRKNDSHPPAPPGALRYRRPQYLVPMRGVCRRIHCRCTGVPGNHLVVAIHRPLLSLATHVTQHLRLLGPLWSLSCSATPSSPLSNVCSNDRHALSARSMHQSVLRCPACKSTAYGYFGSDHSRQCFSVAERLRQSVNGPSALLCSPTWSSSSSTSPSSRRSADRCQTTSCKR